MSILFVADRSFDDFPLLSRAFVVAVETSVRNGGGVEVAALDNSPLRGLLIQLADITNDYVGEKLVSVAPSGRGKVGANTVVAFTPLSYYPYRSFVRSAKDEPNVTVLEY